MRLTDFRGKRVVITGARGFLGQAFTKTFADLGATVVAVDRYALAAELGAPKPVMRAGVEHVDWDVTQTRGFPIHGPVDYVLSLAAIASPVHYTRRSLECFDVIVRGTRNMLELAREKDATFLLSSTSELYGNPATVPTPEGQLGVLDPWSPRGRAYDVPKLAAEALASIYVERGVDVRVVRYFNCYGPGLALGDYRVLPTFVGKILRGERLQVYGSGRQTRTFCYVTDAVDATLRVLADGERGVPYNIGNDRPEVTMQDVAVQLQLAAGRDFDQFPIEYVKPPAAYLAEPQRRCPDLTRIRALGYEPQVDLVEGLQRYYDWARTCVP